MNDNTRRRLLTRTNLFAVTASITLGLAAQSSADEVRPNLLFIIADQHCADVMSCAGNPFVETPALDRLAQHGVRFTRAYVTHPLCIPSRASFMTGRMPSQCRDDVQAHRSLGAYLQAGGYDTGYFGKWHIRPSESEDNSGWHGFETLDTGVIDSVTARNSVEFIRREREKPFFLIASFLNPHDICEWARIHSGVSDEMRNGAVNPAPDPAVCPPLPPNFDPPPDEPEVVRQRLVHDERARTSVHPTSHWTATDWRQYRWAYCRLVEKVDSQIGRLLDALEETGQLENTVIVYSSDHGDGNAAHGWNQKVVLYEEAIRLPLIVSWKGHTRANVADHRLISMNLDLLPTLCDFAGVPVKEQLHGKSLRPVVMPTTGDESPGPLHPFVVTETKLFDDVEGRMLTTGRLKYIVYSEGEHPEQLFDLQTDPGEMNSLVRESSHQAELRRHRRLLSEWAETHGDAFSLDHVN